MPRRSPRLAAQAAAACPLLQLSDDVLEVVGHQISDALRPAVAGALAACSHNLWRVMQAPLTKLQPRHAEARALAAKVGRSCAELRETRRLYWVDIDLNPADMTTLAMLFSTGALARVERLWLADNSLIGPAGASALFDGLDSGAAPRLTWLNLQFNRVRDAGASALATALSRGALPKLADLYIAGNETGDEGLVALAPALRRRPALKRLSLSHNNITDVGVASLFDNLGDKELKQLKVLDLAYNQVGDAGCAALVAALDGAALPALMGAGSAGVFPMPENPASDAAMQAVVDALRANGARRDAVQLAAM